MTADIDNRLKTIFTLRVKTPTLNAIMDDMDRVRRTAKLINYSEQPHSIIVIAETSVGKTTLINEYLKRKDNQPYELINDNEEVSIKPVLSVSIPPEKGVKAGPMTILHALGDPLYNKGTEAEMNMRFAKLAKKCGVELIIFDEFQNIIERGTETIYYQVAEWIKTLINNTNIPIVLFGMPWSTRVLNANDQLNSRFKIKREISRYSKDTMTDWMLALQQIDQALPFEREIGICKKELALRLLAATSGTMGNLMKGIIQPAAERAVNERLDTIPQEYLLESSIELLNCSRNESPLGKMPLTEVFKKFPITLEQYKKSASAYDYRDTDEQNDKNLKIKDVF